MSLAQWMLMQWETARRAKATKAKAKMEESPKISLEVSHQVRRANKSRRGQCPLLEKALRIQSTLLGIVFFAKSGSQAGVLLS